MADRSVSGQASLESRLPARWRRRPDRDPAAWRTRPDHSLTGPMQQEAATSGGLFHLRSSTNATVVPFDTRAATRSASQFVRRTQPCDAALDTFPGEGVPWIP